MDLANTLTFNSRECPKKKKKMEVIAPFLCVFNCLVVKKSDSKSYPENHRFDFAVHGNVPLSAPFIAMCCTYDLFIVSLQTLYVMRVSRSRPDQDFIYQRKIIRQQKKK